MADLCAVNMDIMEHVMTTYGLEESSLLTMRYRTHFFRNFLGVPDLVAESVIAKMGDWPELFSTPVANFNCLYLGRRAWLIDAWLAELIANSPRKVLQIVNLGCGLETIFNRLPKGNWIGFNVDFDRVIRLRENLNMDSESVTNLSESILSRDWLDRLNRNQPVVFVLSGVVSYLAPSMVQDLFKMLNQEFPGSSLVFDTVSRPGRILSNFMIKRSGFNSALFQYSVSGEKEFYDFGKSIRQAPLADISRLAWSRKLLGTQLLSWFASFINFGTLWHIRFKSELENSGCANGN